MQLLNSCEFVPLHKVADRKIFDFSIYLLHNPILNFIKLRIRHFLRLHHKTLVIVIVTRYQMYMKMKHCLSRYFIIILNNIKTVRSQLFR